MFMRNAILFLLPVIFLLTCCSTNEVSLSELEEGFKNPPEEARPQVWWHWMAGNVTREGITLDLSSSVMNQYGRQIKAAVLETLERLEVQNANVTVVDKGALECTLKARVECAVFRSCGASSANIPWGGAVR